jgi:hypothetical protein
VVPGKTENLECGAGTGVGLKMWRLKVRVKVLPFPDFKVILSPQE